MRERFDGLEPLVPLAEALRAAGHEWTGENGLRLSARDTGAVGEHFRRVHRASDELTLLVMDAAAEIPGTSVEGLEHRLKTVGSLNRKIADHIEKQGARWPTDPEARDVALATLLNGTRDIARYTVVSAPEKYVATVNAIVDRLRAHDFEQLELKNAWADTERDYQGVNTSWWDPVNEVAFEVQVHTADSLSAKEREHPYYEERRLPGVSPETRVLLEAISRDIFRSVPIPDGVGTIRDYRNVSTSGRVGGDREGRSTVDLGAGDGRQGATEMPASQEPAGSASTGIPDHGLTGPGEGHPPPPPSAGAGHPATHTVIHQPALPSDHSAQGLVVYGRPRDFVGNPFPLFKGDPRRSEVQQGSLGDCGVVATIGAVAGHAPDVVRDMIELQPDGSVQVTVHEVIADASGDRYLPTGRRFRLRLSPEVPADTGSGTMAVYMRQNEVGAAWASMMEKAAAGIDRTWTPTRRAENQVLDQGLEGYARLGNGSNAWTRAELLAQLTGRSAVVREFDLAPGHESLVEAELQGQLAAGKPVLVGVPLPKPGEVLPFDLVGGHAYEVVHVDQGFVELRNPWNRDHPQQMRVRDFLDAVRPSYTTLE